MDTKILYDFIIVGAGLSGTMMAYELSEISSKILVLEKSRGVGGRLSRYENMNLSLDKIESHQCLDKAFGPPDDQGLYQACPLNSYLKNILKSTQGIELKTGVFVEQIVAGPSCWSLRDQRGHCYQTQWLILAMPQPQVIKLSPPTLRVSWNKVDYSEAITIFTEEPCASLEKESKHFSYEHYEKYILTQGCERFLKDGKTLTQALSEYYQTPCVHAHYWRYAQAHVKEDYSTLVLLPDKIAFIGDWIFVEENIPSALRSVFEVSKTLKRL